MRLFVGIPLSTEAVGALETIRRRFGTVGDGLRWADASSWHITLQFLGEAAAEAYECAASRLAEVRFHSVRIRWTQPGSFDRAGIFFAGVALTPDLAELEGLVKRATGHCGFVSENRRYQPHVTLARSKGALGKQSLRRLGKNTGLISDAAEILLRTEFEAEEFLLYESFTRSDGPRYEVRRRFPLSANA